MHVRIILPLPSSAVVKDVISDFAVGKLKKSSENRQRNSQVIDIFRLQIDGVNAIGQDGMESDGWQLDGLVGWDGVGSDEQNEMRWMV